MCCNCEALLPNMARKSVQRNWSCLDSADDCTNKNSERGQRSSASAESISLDNLLRDMSVEERSSSSSSRSRAGGGTRERKIKFADDAAESMHPFGWERPATCARSC